MKLEDVTKGNEPFDRLTELCDEMSKVLRTEDNADVKAIIFLNDPEHGGIVTVGYKDEVEAMSHLLIHMKAMFSAAGKNFGVLTDQGLLLLDDLEP